MKVMRAGGRRDARGREAGRHPDPRRRPLADIRNKNSVSFVMVNGEFFDANTMAQLWPVERPAPDRFRVDDNPPGMAGANR